MKKTVLGIMLNLVFLVTFNVLFFMLGGVEHPASVWLSYGFIHFAYMMILVTPLLIRKSSKATLFGFSVYSISSVYFIVEFIAGLIFIFLRSESLKAALVTQIIIAAIYALSLLTHLLANEYTADSIDRKEEEVAYIKNAASRVKALVGLIPDKKANKAIEKAYDILHTSPTKSIATARSIETQVINTVTQLEEAVYIKDIANIITFSGEIVSLMEARNRKLRLAQ